MLYWATSQDGEETKQLRVADGTGKVTLMHGCLLRMRLPYLACLPEFDLVIMAQEC